MFGIVLDLPGGAKADFNELQYISALHQAGKSIRKEGTVVGDFLRISPLLVSAKDIIRFLSSRHGIKVDLGKVKDEILKDLSVMCEDDKKESIDLPEITALLLVPFLLKAREIVETSPAKPSVAEPVVVRKYKRESIPSNLSEWDRQEFDCKCDLSDQLTLTTSEAIIRGVLDMMLQGATGLTSPTEPPILDKQLLRSIFRKYGLSKLANNDLLLAEMIDVVGLADQEVFNITSFMRALTNDVLLFDIDRELECTTNYYDVFHADPTAGGDTEFKYADQTVKLLFSGAGAVSCMKRDDKVDVEAFTHLSKDNGLTDVMPKSSSTNKALNNETTKYWTTPCIDFSSDTMRSKHFVAALLLGYLLLTLALTFFNNTWEDSFQATYCGSSEESTATTIDENVRAVILSLRQATVNGTNDLFTVTNPGDGSAKSAFGCRIGMSVITYFLRGIAFGALGWTYVGLGGLGNSVRERSVFPMIISIVTIFVINAMFVDGEKGPYKMNLMNSGLLQDTRGVKTVGQILSLCLEFTVIMLQLLNIARLLFLKCWKARKRCTMSWLFTHPSVKAEAKLKQSAALKLNALVKNAYAVHELAQTQGQASKTVEAHGHHTKREEIGIQWTLKNFLSGDLLAKEGIWISSRAVTANFYHIVAIIWFFAKILSIVAATSSDGHQCTRDVCGEQNICAITCDFQDLCIAEFCYCDGCKPKSALFSDRVIFIGAISGGCFGVVNMVIIACRYIPMYIVTILKFRTGLLPSLNNEEFPDFRNDADFVRLILGYAFWGPIISSFLICGVAVLVVYCFTSPYTQGETFHYFNGLVGCWICIILKLIFLYFWRKRYMGGFYRKDPTATNVLGLFLESWNLILAPGYVAFRAIKVFLITIFHIGRIDSPVLTKGNTVIQPKNLTEDLTPHVFVQDCLLHEAHRHPYLELLGKLYLYKLRYGDRFVRTSGSCWRLLFTLTLMPWMGKYLDRQDKALGYDGHDKHGMNMDNNSSKEMDLLKKRIVELEEQLACFKGSVPPSISESSRESDVSSRMEDTGHHASELQGSLFMHPEGSTVVQNDNSSHDEVGRDDEDELQEKLTMLNAEKSTRFEI